MRPIVTDERAKRKEKERPFIRCFGSIRLNLRLWGQQRTPFSEAATA